MTPATLCSAQQKTRRLATLPPSSSRSLRSTAASTRPTSSCKLPERTILQPLLQRSSAAVRVEPAGRQFARQRLGRTVELVGSCIMLLGFLVLALFG